MENVINDQKPGSEPDAEVTSNATGAGTGQVEGENRFRPRFFPIEEIENLEYYRPGGFHPIAIGDTLKDGRYQIMDKISHGGYSTIWMARDNSAGGYVAVKIGISDSDVKSQEKEIMRKLLQSDDDRASMILPLLDDFILNGPNGLHPCLVTTPARMSIAAAKDFTYKQNVFPLATARAIAAQLAQVIAFCHTQGVVHGDLHTGNILLRFPPHDNIHTLSQAGFYERFGPPYQEPVRNADLSPAPHVAGVPTHGVVGWAPGCRPQEVTLVESAIFLTDFGESWMPSSAQQRTHCHAPLGVRPPEAYFATTGLSFPADIWALACVVWDVVGGFSSLFGSSFGDEDGVRADWVHTLGRLPEKWWAAWDGEFRRKVFTEDGLVTAEGQGYIISSSPGLGGRFEDLVQQKRLEGGMEKFPDEEKAALLKMLKAMLAYEPADRINAEGVLSTEWMLGWGLPALEELKRLTKAATMNAAGRENAADHKEIGAALQKGEKVQHEPEEKSERSQEKSGQEI